MSGFDPNQIRRVAEAIAREIQGGQLGSNPAPAPKIDVGGTTVPSVSLGDGVFSTIDEAAHAAKAAFLAYSQMDRNVRFAIVKAMRDALTPEIENMSRMAVAETGLGRVEDKIQKNRLVITKTPGPEGLNAAVDTGDNGLTLYEPAPFGVFGSITPCTNPTSTIICNSIGMVAAGNSVVFNVHPTAKAVSVWLIQFLNRVIVGAGGPPNLLTCIPVPTIKSAGELMHHPQIRILAVTGGGGVVKAAMNSGKRAICAGPGNPPCVVDETADIARAGRDIVAGHSFDNNVICTDEKEVIAVASIADDLIKSMGQNGAYILRKGDLGRLEKAIFSKGAGPRGHATVNREFVGKNAENILRALGLPGGPEVRTIVAEVSNDHPLVWTEQMMPVLPVTRVPNCDAAIALAVEAEGGCFHTASMHSHDVTKLSKMARACNCSIFVKNAPNYAGLGHGGEGHTSFTIASPTGEGLTGPRTFSRWRRCTLKDSFRIV